MNLVKRLIGLAVAGFVSVAVVSGCGSSSHPASPGASPGGTSATAAASGKITVFAAASLKKAFTDLGDQLKADNPGADVAFNFGGSADLVTQIINGAPADVFASADTATMVKATDAGLVSGAPVNFATNTLTIVVAPGNPKQIASFADLTKPGTRVVVCAPQQPCGAAAKKVEDATGTTLAPVSEETTDADVVNKVISGQADAGVVYVTDAAVAGDRVTVVAFPESAQAVNTYPIAVLKNTQNAALAHKFVDLITGPKGQDALHKAGFATP